MQERLTTLEIPIRPQSEVVAETLTDLTAARRTLAEYGVAFPAHSRVDQALAILKHAQTSGALVPVHRGDADGLRALELSFDYSAIAATLPENAIASVRRELGISLEGHLDGQELNGQPAQYQSQYVARAALVRAGLSPQHCTHSTQGGRKSPDIVVENGHSKYGIEVKRPRFLKNLVPRFNDGRDQLEPFEDGGGVIVDLTDCLRDVPVSVVDSQVSESVAILKGLVGTERGYNPGYHSIKFAGIVVRSAWGVVEGRRQAHILVHTSTAFVSFGKGPNTIDHRRGIWLRETIGKGYEQLYRTMGEVER